MNEEYDPVVNPFHYYTLWQQAEAALAAERERAEAIGHLWFRVIEANAGRKNAETARADVERGLKMLDAHPAPEPSKDGE